MCPLRCQDHGPRPGERRHVLLLRPLRRSERSEGFAGSDLIGTLVPAALDFDKFAEAKSGKLTESVGEVAPALTPAIDLYCCSLCCAFCHEPVASPGCRQERRR